MENSLTIMDLGHDNYEELTSKFSAHRPREMDQGDNVSRITWIADLATDSDEVRQLITYLNTTRNV